MQKLTFFFWVVVTGFAFSTSGFSQGAADCGCLSMLNRNIYNVITINQSTDIAESFRRIQCASQFSTHAEALEAGFQLSVPIYGVPLQVGGVFTEHLRSSWKEQNCEDQDFQYALSSQISFSQRYVPPALFQSFNTCLDFCRSGQNGLSCWADTPTEDHVTFAVRWFPPEGVNDPPRVVSSLVGGAYNPTLGQGDIRLFLEGTSIRVGTTTVPLQKLPGPSFVYTQLSTDRGDCAIATRPPATYSLLFRIGARINVAEARSQSFRQEYSTDSCGTNMPVERTFCIDNADVVTGYQISDTCTRFGSGLANVVRTNDRCHLVSGHLRSRGFDVVRACRGTGCWHYNIILTGEQYVERSLSEHEVRLGELQQTSFSARYPAELIPPNSRDINWYYTVTVEETRGDQVSRIQLSDVDESAGRFQSRVTSDGNNKVRDNSLLRTCSRFRFSQCSERV